ncbi:hypothetical protein [Paenibacillus apiarius]|uniref:hypothetical protein n=1 Tax=Paenibacillus apiarius TaxID=46240 RepID=UPI0019801DE3|nr:hypothetical protein [Paenibacillus apiarius]MBN3526679.1 hypothetical protein [Paenibacillus apiarius]
MQYKGQASPQIYRIVFDCYQLAERQDDSLLYRVYRDHLPDNGWITDKLPYQALLLLQEMVKQHHPEQARQSGRCHFLLDELLHIVFSNGWTKRRSFCQKLIEAKEDIKEISFEMVPEFAGDYIFLDSGKDGQFEWSGSFWKSLKAVKNNRVYDLDGDFFWPYDPIAVKAQVKKVAQMLVEGNKK